MSTQEHGGSSALVTADPISVRTGKTYNYDFGVRLGQRNARFTTGAVTPHLSHRFVRFLPFLHRLQGIALIEPGYDLLHLKNAVPLFHTKPYILTFEDFLPRVPEDFYVAGLHRFLLRALASSRCKRILAQSEYGVRTFMVQNRGLPHLEAVRAKMEVLRPVLPKRADRPKKRSDGLRLLFVGRDFLRKGGPALTRAHEILRKAGAPVESVVVSDFRWADLDYVGPRDPELSEAERRRAARAGLDLRGSQPRAEVARLMREADFLVFPTLHDTYGFVTLEALASGTPVIASNTCAQPEMVQHGINGWLLPFENDSEIGRWRWLYRIDEPDYGEAYRQATERMGGDIAESLLSALEGSADYEEMSAAALATIDAGHDVASARARLERIYADAVGRPG